MTGTDSAGLTPSFARAYVARALTYSLQNKLDLAMRDMDSAINLDGMVAKDVDTGMELAYYRIGVAYRQQGRNINAVAFLSKSIQLQPQMIEAFLERSRVYSFNGWADLVIADLTKAIKLDPGLALAYSLRGSAYISKNEFKLALADLNRAISLDASLAETYCHRGWVYYNLNDYASAASDLNIAIMRDPTSALSHYYRGMLYQSEGKNDLAIADFRKAQELVTDSKLMGRIEQALAALTGK